MTTLLDRCNEAVPPVVVAGMRIPHNGVRWETRRNRHPTTGGLSWGWIEGAAGNVCWENGTSFDSDAAEAACREHNAWLERQRPLAVRITELRDKFAAVEREESAMRKRLIEKERELDSLRGELERLLSEAV